jgi:hypothetical protein
MAAVWGETDNSYLYGFARTSALAYCWAKRVPMATRHDHYFPVNNAWQRGRDRNGGAYSYCGGRFGIRASLIVRLSPATSTGGLVYSGSIPLPRC